MSSDNDLVFEVVSPTNRSLFILPWRNYIFKFVPIKYIKIAFWIKALICNYDNIWYYAFNCALFKSGLIYYVDQNCSIIGKKDYLFKKLSHQFSLMNWMWICINLAHSFKRVFWGNLKINNDKQLVNILVKIFLSHFYIIYKLLFLWTFSDLYLYMH